MFNDAQTKPAMRYPEYELLADTASRLADEIAGRKQTPEFATGLEVVDIGLHGLHRRQLLTIAARPGIGKTSFACKIAYELARRGKKVTFISLEMGKLSILERMFSIIHKIKARDLQKGIFSEAVSKAFSRFAHDCNTLPLRIIDDYCFTENELFTLIENWEHHPDILIVDHLQHIRSDFRRSQYESLSEYLRHLKELAMRHNIAVVLLSQINRAGDSAPTNSNLKGTGSIEEMSDAVFLIQQNSEKNNTNNKNDYRITISKNRYGPTGYFNLYFDAETTSFYNNVAEYQEPT